MAVRKKPFDSLGRRSYEQNDQVNAPDGDDEVERAPYAPPYAGDPPYASDKNGETTQKVDGEPEQKPDETDAERTSGDGVPTKRRR